MALPYDVLISLLIPTSIFINLYFSPYTKVEESFAIQAIHDFTSYGIPLGNVTEVAEKFDHVNFPGSVPRSFFAPAFLSILSFLPIGFVRTPLLKQIAVRGILAFINALSLLHLLETIDTSFGTAAGTWFALFQASQFRVNYYASRTLPNMFAFGVVTYASSFFIQAISTAEPSAAQKKYERCLYYMALVATVVRSEVALLVIPMAATSLLLTWKRAPPANRTMSLLLQTAYDVAIGPIITGLGYGLFFSVPIDSVLWFPAYHDISNGFPGFFTKEIKDALLWPELAALKYNAIDGHASDWGVAPWHFYLTSAIPGLLLNPLTYLVCIPVALFFSPRARSVVWPCVPFVAIMSLLGHKEWRFIVYIAPLLTGIAAVGAARLTEPKKVPKPKSKWSSIAPPKRSALQALVRWVLILTVLLTAGASLVSLFLSSLNYPGATALVTLRQHLLTHPTYAATLPPYDPTMPLEPVPINIWASNLALQTGITRFLTSGGLLLRRGPEPVPAVVKLDIDKTDSATAFLDPAFWAKFDFAIAEKPEQLIGAWDVLDTVYAYDGLNVLKPGEEGNDKMPFLLEHHVKKGAEGAGVVEQAKEIVEEIVGDRNVAQRKLESLGQWKVYLAEVASKSWNGTMKEGDWNELYNAVKAWSRDRVTRGYWVEVKMMPKLRVLQRMRHEEADPLGN